MLKGIVRLEFVDVETGKVNREVTQENFIFFENYAALWLSSNVIERPCIVGRGTDVFPVYDKKKAYYSRDVAYLTGYAPSGTSLKKFYQKTDDSPAYWDYYSLFLPPSVTSSIPCIALTTSVTDNYNHDFAYSGDSLYTALNLDPYCYQSPTEYLNIYYRLILIEDSENQSPDFIKNQFVQDVNRGTGKVIFPNVTHKTYPFRIEQDTSKNGFVNFLPYYHYGLANKELAYPDLEHGKLVNVQKTYTYPDANPNQYTQINYATINMVFRGFNNNLTNFTTVGGSFGIAVGVNPLKITPEITESFTGIGNVFSSSKASTITLFDAANFPTGSGRMKTGGILSNEEKDPFASVIQVEVQNSSQHMEGGTYRFYETRITGNSVIPESIGLPLLPWATITNTDPSPITTYSNYKNMMYKEPDKVHFSHDRIVKYVENRAFITWDKTGILIYDIYHGKIENFDATTQPSLGVTNINDVKVDIYQNIWISCADTGLWKLVIVDEDTIELTHIGVLPGSQQKCYAIDVDNSGNVYAIFWGTGLFFSMDSGVSWANVPIDYSPFSGFESGGFVSKWSYVSRMVCNPNRNAANGTGQLLILLSTNSPDYALSGGCWYDFQSQLTTGITTTAMKNQFANVRSYRYSENVVVSDDTQTWYFMGDSQNMYWSPYQGNATMSGYTVASPAGNLNILNKEWVWDTDSGAMREYIYIGVPLNGRNSIYGERYVDIFDVKLKAQVKHVLIPTGTSEYGNSAHQACAIKLGKNLIVTCARRVSSSSSSTIMGFSVSHQFWHSKTLRQWASDSYGWTGSQWSKNHLGNKPLHTELNDIKRGSKVRFVDGHSATTSWSSGDTFTFTIFDGFFKDNSSTMALRDTIYYKPTDVNESFTPSVVTRIDKTMDTGILHKSPIELEWNIDDLPDTTYSAGDVVTDGDPSFSSVVYLSLFNTEQGIYPAKGEHNQVLGAPYIDPVNTILGDASLKLTGQTGYVMEPTTATNLGTIFTYEGMFKPAETGKKMYLFDSRTDATGAFSLLINAAGRLQVELSSSTYGNIGDFLLPGSTYYITLERNGSNWKVKVNGVLQFEFTNSVNFSTTTSFHLFKRFAPTVDGHEGFIGWASNIRVTRNVIRATNVVPTTFFKTYGNDMSGATMTLSGNYSTGAIVSSHDLVGDWDVVFRGYTDQHKKTRRSRPLFAFGVSVQHFIESPTDISYRVCGSKFGQFAQNRSSEVEIPVGANAIRFNKTGEWISVYYSTDGGMTWVTQAANIRDLNPLHHIVMWQVQPDTEPFITPAVEITSNGTAIFSKVGQEVSGKGYFRDKFLAADVYRESDVSISLSGVKVTKVRSNFIDPAAPLKGEILAMQGGTITFHEEDIGKTISGRIITIRD